MTLIVFAVLAVFVGLLSVFTLLPASTPSSVGGVPVGVVAPQFVLPIYGGGGSDSLDLHALRGHPVLFNF